MATARQTGKEEERKLTDMNKPEIFKTTEEAIQNAGRSRPDGLGTAYYTVRILASAAKTPGEIISQIVAAGWHLIGGPVQVPAIGDVPEHVIVSMLRHEPRPLEIRGDLRIGGEIRGIAGAER